MRPATLTLALLLALASTACMGNESDVLRTGRSGVTGTVVKKKHSGKWFKLTIRDPDGKTAKLFVRRSAYRACGIGESYPDCVNG